MISQNLINCGIYKNVLLKIKNDRNLISVIFVVDVDKYITYHPRLFTKSTITPAIELSSISSTG